MVRKFGKPSFFISFTCNPEREEFGEDKDEGVLIENRLDLVCRVFQLKLKELLRDLTERHVMGEVRAHTYVIEFQKRDLPHAHILIIIDKEDDFNAENVDAAVQAHIPDESEYKCLYDLVIKHMVHKNCKDHRERCLSR